MHIDEVLHEWIAWPIDEPPQVVGEFTAGLNHQTAVVQAGAQKFVLKSFRDRGKVAIQAQEAAAAKHLAPQVLFKDSQWRYMLMELVNAQTLTPAEVGDVELKSIAGALKALHGLNVPASTNSNFSICEFCAQYLERAGEKAAQWHEQLSRILDEFERDATPRAFCHNDLVAANCFVEGGQALFIDWEYAAAHNPWFDLAAIIIYQKLSAEQAQDFLQSYDSTFANHVERSIFFTSQIALLWGDMLWHLDQFGEGHWPQLAYKSRVLKNLANQLGVSLA